MEKTIVIGETTYQLRFKLGVFSHIKDITGKDGIAYMNTVGEDIPSGCFSLVLAAARCYCDKHGGTVDEAKLKADVYNDAGIKEYKEVTGYYNEFVEGNVEPVTAIPSPTKASKKSLMEA